MGNAVKFRCDVNGGNAMALPHFWEHCVGSCHATMALRADWQRQLARCHHELGFKHVRFHGLLSDDMSTLTCEKNELQYSFFNMDQIFDFLLSIGMRPFVELSFMPAAISSGTDTVFHYKGNIDPPKDYNIWAMLICKLVTHLVDRYGISEVGQWFFEVWNEPNLDIFWKGSQAEYFELYKYTVQAIKKVDPCLKTGGPATARNEWISELLYYCEKEGLPVDFISTHHYPNDAFGKPGEDTITQLSKAKRSGPRDEAQQVKKLAKNKPVYYTEWSSSSNPFDMLHDQPYTAAFIIKTVMEAGGALEGYSYWTFSDLFEENYFSSVPFHGGFGLLNIHGVPKPAYRAFELLHRLGDELLATEGRHDTVDIWVVRKQKTLNILISNWALPNHSINAETVRIELINAGDINSIYAERIDDNHANAPKAWMEMGCPEVLAQETIDLLEMASALNREMLPVVQENEKTFIEIMIHPQSVVCITVERN